MIVLLFCVILSSSAWGTVLVRWNAATLPPASSLGVNEIVVAWDGGTASALLAAAHKQGYRV